MKLSAALAIQTPLPYSPAPERESLGWVDTIVTSFSCSFIRSRTITCEKDSAQATRLVRRFCLTPAYHCLNLSYFSDLWSQ